MTDERTELTADERVGFAALQREKEPPRLLEARTVMALHEQGLLRPVRNRFPGASVPAWALGLAASLVLFLAGVAAGQLLEARAMARAMAAAQQDTAMQTASLVQRTGSAYVTALAALAQLADSSSDPAVAQGREAALTSLHAAARELAALAPEDPLAVLLRDRFGGASRGDAGEAGPVVQSVVWF